MRRPYFEAVRPIPAVERAAWYKNTFPTYFGIFLWVGFYLKLAGPTIGIADFGVSLLALPVAGLLCFALYYYVPAILGMKTGRPLYVIGASTFGTTGGYVIPGLLMGVLQLGWVAVISSVAVSFLMGGLHQTGGELFTVLVIVWIYGLAWVAVKGIRYVGHVAKFLNWIPFLMIVIVFFQNYSGIAAYHPPSHEPILAFLNVITIVIGYFATAGAAGADFGMTNRNRKDIALGGIFGIVGGVVIAGALPILSVAGYIGQTGNAASYDYTVAIENVGALAPAMLFLFAAASLVPTCFSSFIASNSFSTMLPSVPRVVSTFLGVTISAVLVLTGVANNLVGFFSIVGASFGPICGAIAADYLMEGRQWSGPRKGINWAGYCAWATGFIAGALDHIPGVPDRWIKMDNPAVLISFGVGFLVYLFLARLGFRPSLLASGTELAEAAVDA
jgi:cytosine permease